MDENERTLTKEDRARAVEQDHKERTDYAIRKNIERNRVSVRG